MEAILKLINRTHFKKSFYFLVKNISVVKHYNAEKIIMSVYE